ncbi:hypothetical protein ACFS6H_16075 [Terrimonas rubra]|uniref:DUF2680 domain-containing protein n=1 Tax=Terrimonas rubra TaxID=1035890 RepID=A0ABW6A7A2_9BACT
MKVILLAITMSLSLSLLAVNKNDKSFEKQQKELEKDIKSAYKKKQITELEYNKLLKEQDVIVYTIEKYKMDGILTPKEKNNINSKLLRAKKRLAKYKRNNEVY